MEWVKAFHIISIVTWFAGLFYLPRLYVYHAMSDDEISNERFKIMERKLYKGIMTPSMLATLISGGWLLSSVWSTYSGDLWLHLKLFLVLILVIYHFYCGRLNTAFKRDNNQHSHVFYRWLNEMPVLGLIAIIIFVVVKPF
ncbi:protoporphyrinogen oxidase HemJ [Gammaproteobacteria bacterium AH-315-C21]|nr:protoporphyrinogen oxidase HemJ [Gammaproteobacteria bacterium AH-315-C21]